MRILLSPQPLIPKGIEMLGFMCSRLVCPKGELMCMSRYRDGGLVKFSTKGWGQSYRAYSRSSGLGVNHPLYRRVVESQVKLCATDLMF